MENKGKKIVGENRNNISSTCSNDSDIDNLSRDINKFGNE